jgi:hypothetical protein
MGAILENYIQGSDVCALPGVARRVGPPPIDTGGKS